MRSVTIVIPAYNEAQEIRGNLLKILEVASALQDVTLRLLVVDDGSRDGTREEVEELRRKDSRVQLLALSRNFGKENAIHAGLSLVTSDAAIVMDADLQHPPELIGQMLERWREGYLVVEGSKKAALRQGSVRRFLTIAFYWIFKRLSGLDIARMTDFKLLDAEVAAAYCRLPERNRFFRGLIHWLGFESFEIEFEVAPRLGEESKWSASQLFRLALRATTGFSSSFLHLVNLAAFSSFALALVIGGKVVWEKIEGVALSGYTTLILLILFVGGVIMFSLGQISLYLEQLFEEVKGRPLYLVDWRRSSPELRQLEAMIRPMSERD